MKRIKMPDSADELVNDSKTLHQRIIEDTGSLLGGCATYFDGTAIHSKQKYIPKTNFGNWLKNLVKRETRRIRQMEKR